MKLNAVGLRGARALAPSEISGGMARRVALARAIALDPELMMYDEPFAGLDPISLGITAKLIRTINDALGATSILVTHDVPESFAIADYVYFIAERRDSRRRHAGAAARVAGPDRAPVHRRHAGRSFQVPLREPAARRGFRHRRAGMISALGRWVLDGFGTAGYATRMFVRLVLEFFPLLRRPRLVTKQIHFVGNYSLVIIAVSGLFVGFVLGLAGLLHAESLRLGTGARAARRAVARARARAGRHGAAVRGARGHVAARPKSA